ncbi:hypothetical protein [Streptomyces sp. B6B3]|uniref:hypothetical protein n=1 Tax=Streptomyces sp. B6B3 TaxID=3153570 RepID=UPI00325DB5C4
MDSTEILAAAVGLMTGAAASAVNAVGAGAGDAVFTLVRERLGGSTEGQAALTRVDGEPADPATAVALLVALQRESARDPGFVEELARAMGGPPAPTSATGNLTVSGTKMRNSHIVLGPLTVNNTRQARFSLAAAAAVLVALVALAVYGGRELVAGDDPGTANAPVATATEPTSQAEAGEGAGTTAEPTPTPAPGTPDGSESADWSCLEELFSQEPDVIAQYELPLGRTASGYMNSGNSEHPAALILQQDGETVAAVRTSYESHLGLDVLDVVDASCEPLAFDLHRSDDGGVLELEIGGAGYEVVMELDILGNFSEVIFQPAGG